MINNKEKYYKKYYIQDGKHNGIKKNINYKHLIENTKNSKHKQL